MLQLKKVLCLYKEVIALLLCLSSQLPAYAILPNEKAGFFSVSQTGAATYSIPLDVSPGVAGMQPDLTISYNSQGGNGLLGVGWSIGGSSYITRCRATPSMDGYQGTVSFDQSDRFCVDGQRLILVSGTYGAAGSVYRTNIDTFARVTAVGSQGVGPSYFTAETKDGNRHTFGGDASSRVTRADNSVFAWAVSRVADRSNNYRSYQYTNLNNELTLNSIQYGSAVGQTGSVTLQYATRPDIVTRYQAGTAFLNSKLLTKVVTDTKAYSLSYSQSKTSKRSLLVGINECDAASGLMCSPTSMTWSNPSTSYYPTTSWTSSGFGPTQGYANNNTHPRMIGDVNGDGVNDIVAFASDGPYLSVTDRGTCSTPCGFVYPNRWVDGFGVNAGWVDQDTYPRTLADVNADGKVEIVGFGSDGVYVSTFNGAFQQIPARWGTSFGVNAGGWTNNNVYPRMLADVNGDGRADIVGFGGAGAYVSVSNGSAFGTPSLWVAGFGTSQGWSDNKTYPRFLVDVNGDAMADVVGFANDGVYVSLSNGSAFAAPQRWVMNFGTTNGWTNNDAYPRTLADVNGDGLPDVVGFGGAGVFISLNTGIGFTDSTLWLADFGINQGWSWSGKNNKPRYVADVNGDGMADVIGVDSVGAKVGYSTGAKFGSVFPLGGNGGTTDLNEYPIYFSDVSGDGQADFVAFRSSNVDVANSETIAPDLVRKFGSVSEVFYWPLTRRFHTKEATAAYPIADYMGSLHAVSSVTVPGTNLVSNYTYYGAKVDVREGTFLGFHHIQTRDADGVWTFTEYAQNRPYLGLILSEEKWKDWRSYFSYGPFSGSRISRKTLTYSNLKTVAANIDVNFPYASNVVERFYDILTGNISGQTSTTTQYDNFGNATTVNVVTNDGYTTNSSFTYWNDTTNWLIGKVTQSQVTRSGPSVAAQTRTVSYAYNPTTGDRTSEVIEPNNYSLRLQTDYAYDAFGNVSTATVSGADIQTRSTSKEYSVDGRFPIKVTNAIGQSESRTFDNKTGAMLSLTGPNGLTTGWTYDLQGRKIKETRSDGTTTEWRYLLCAELAVYGYPTCQALASRLVATVSSGAPTVVQYYDVLNRVIRTASQGYDGRWIYVDQVYDSNARPWKTSLPYYANETAYWTEVNYDAAGRIIKEIASDGSITTTSYNGLTVFVTNSKNQTTTKTVNSLGQLVSVVDAQNNKISYYYDAFGNLIQTVDPKNNVINMRYDLLGRKTGMDDPDKGTWSYAYNVLGEMVSQTNGKGQVVTMAYDLLGRLTQRVEPEMTSRWFYDTASYGKGKLAQTTTTTGVSKTYTYDTLGRASGVTTTVEGKSYGFAKSYDSVGRPLTLTYPFSTVKATYAYNQYGYLSNLQNSVTGQSIWDSPAYDAFGHVTYYRNGIEGTTVSRSYNPTTGLVKTIKSSYGATTLQDDSYSFDSLGNLTSRVDNVQGFTEVFSYDSLNRLTATSGGPAGNQTYQYDSIGNITYKSDAGSYLYGAKPHAVTQVSGIVNATYNYDTNGNMTSGDRRTITYTSWDMPTRINRDTFSIDFSYDEGHQRVVERRNNGKVTIKINPFEREIAADGTYDDKFYISAGGELIGVISSQTGVTSFLKDHLGSVKVAVQVGVVKGRYYYDAWGKRSVVSGSSDATNRGYTEHEMLDEVGLVHMNGRIYDPVLGRFQSADPYIKDFDDTQGFNRYTYVNNNPLSFTDPSGYWSVKGALKSIGKEIKNTSSHTVGWVDREVVKPVVAETKNTLSHTVGYVKRESRLTFNGMMRNIKENPKHWGVGLMVVGAITMVTLGDTVTIQIGMGLAVAVPNTAAVVAGTMIASGAAMVSTGQPQVVVPIAATCCTSSGTTTGGSSGSSGSSASSAQYQANEAAAKQESEYGREGTMQEAGSMYADAGLTGTDASSQIVIGNPTGGDIRGCDNWGCGDYGASRGDREHVGVDFISTPGQVVTSPIDGVVVRGASPYGPSHPELQGVLIRSSEQNIEVKLFYVSPYPYVIGLSVTQGAAIGVAQDLSGIYPGISNHVHQQVEVDGNPYNPTR